MLSRALGSAYSQLKRLKGFNMNKRKRRFFYLKVKPWKLRLKCEYLDETVESSSAVQTESLDSGDAQPTLIEHQKVEGIGQTSRKKKISG